MYHVAGAGKGSLSSSPNEINDYSLSLTQTTSLPILNYQLDGPDNMTKAAAARAMSRSANDTEEIASPLCL